MEEQIKTLAGLFFKPEEIETILELDPGSLSSGPFNRAFLAGSLSAEKDFWDSVFSLAKKGSSPAQEMIYKRLSTFKSSQIHAAD